MVRSVYTAVGVSVLSILLIPLSIIAMVRDGDPWTAIGGFGLTVVLAAVAWTGWREVRAMMKERHDVQVDE